MLNVGLIGCGRIANRHAELLGTGKVAGARLSAVCDIVAGRAEQLGARHGVRHYTDMHDMLSQAPVDVAVILTESGLHAEHAIVASGYRKHVVVEKPMALTLVDADRMIAACDRAGVRLFVVKQNRFNVPIVKLREALDAGRFGKLVLGTVRVRWCRTQEYYDQASWRGTWALDGGVLANQASHHVDMLQWMLGDVESVFAMGRTALVRIEAEDTALVLLRFTSGAMGVIEATTAARPNDLEGSISILGERGSVVVGGFAMNEMVTWRFTESQSGDETVLDNYSVNPPNVYGFGHLAYYNHVVSSITNDSPHLVDGLAGRKSLELISAIYESIETRSEVSLRYIPSKCRLGLRNG